MTRPSATEQPEQANERMPVAMRCGPKPTSSGTRSMARATCSAGPVDRIRHPRVQVAEYERRSLDADQVRDLQPGFAISSRNSPGRWQKR
jgi:hypothetical protein